MFGCSVNSKQKVSLTCVSEEGKFVDGLDERAKIFLIVGRIDQVLEGVELGRIDLTVPLQLVLAFGNHVMQIGTLVHPDLEAGVKSGGADIECISGEADQIKVPVFKLGKLLNAFTIRCHARVLTPLYEVEDHLLPDNLLLLWRDVILPLCLDDAFT